MEGPAAPRWAWWVATGFGSGRIRPAPGTWGSLAALAAWCLPARAALAAPPWAGELLFLALPLLMTWVAVEASDRVVLETGTKDPGWIVADEWAGLWIALWAVRWEAARALAGPWDLRLAVLLGVPFLLFRLFDIGKPWPVRQIQVLPGGAGIVADDVVAGLYALPLAQLLVPMGLRMLA
ncbi:MAG TPA: phosphatidylglycerophosphatase A [Holophaga sp.]|nr:phosphatidylglycerophosphatase A [Holophaga sp.]